MTVLRKLLSGGLLVLLSTLIGWKQGKTISDFDKFTGRWKLFKIQIQHATSKNWSDAGGNNANRKGFIIYDGLGGMGVHHVPGYYDQYVFENKGSLDSLTKNDLRHLANNFVYFGKYKVNEVDKIVEHYIESHSNPDAWGTIAKRGYEFKADTLILSPLNTETGNKTRIIWVRLNDKTN